MPGGGDGGWVGHGCCESVVNDGKSNAEMLAAATLDCELRSGVCVFRRLG